ncbi:PEP-CTERM sorting domain-containing protein [Desulfonatronovibrio hydrogenovorans]|uniref:PEP-CTERM sorting domain-containing protein n=1 Tax=Desulfonatronovibrio hydrogenovorans TaxID=53245 RepID=UPI00048A5269|nr:PEP-CTERM sorting domain-containing protein [Desulfonatronovibrio hydrogenovorans]
MKRFKMFLCAMTLSLFMAASAQALPLMFGWDLDLTSLGGPKYENIRSVSVVGSSYLTQNLTGVGGGGAYYYMQEGDAFFETSILYQLSFVPEGGGLPQNMQHLYLWGNNITGTVKNVDNAGASPNPADWDFDYSFDLGQTNLGMYYYDGPANVLDPFSFDPTAPGVTQLAQFQLVAPSAGTGPEGFLGGGDEFTGKTSMTGLFIDFEPGVWFTPGGNSFESMVAMGYDYYALLSLDNVIAPNNFNFVFGDDFFTSLIEHDGSYRLAEVPEPTTWLLFGTGLLGLAALGRRKMQKK